MSTDGSISLYVYPAGGGCVRTFGFMDQTRSLNRFPLLALPHFPRVGSREIAWQAHDRSPSCVPGRSFFFSLCVCGCTSPQGATEQEQASIIARKGGVKMSEIECACVLSAVSLEKNIRARVTRGARHALLYRRRACMHSRVLA